MVAYIVEWLGESGHVQETVHGSRVPVPGEYVSLDPDTPAMFVRQVVHLVCLPADDPAAIVRVDGGL